MRTRVIAVRVRAWRGRGRSLRRRHVAQCPRASSQRPCTAPYSVVEKAARAARGLAAGGSAASEEIAPRRAAMTADGVRALPARACLCAAARNCDRLGGGRVRLETFKHSLKQQRSNEEHAPSPQLELSACGAPGTLRRRGAWAPGGVDDGGQHRRAREAGVRRVTRARSVRHWSAPVKNAPPAAFARAASRSSAGMSARNSARRTSAARMAWPEKAANSAFCAPVGGARLSK